MWKRLDSRYSISDLGLVYDHKLKKQPKLCVSNCGYQRVSIHGRMTALHRLVGLQFIANPLNKPNINHIDKNRLNNRATNLEWCTQKENISHSYTTSRISGNAKIGIADLKYILQCISDKSVKTKDLAIKYNISVRTIHAYMQGRNLKRVNM